MTARSKRFQAGSRVPTPQEIIEKFPTPTASDSVRMRYSTESLRKVGEARTKMERKPNGCNLPEYVAVFPNADGKQTEQNGGKLNPEWVEWLQGFPIGWTDCDV